MKAAIYTFLILLSLASCKEESTVLTEFYVGTYTDGESEGIYKYAIDEEGNLSKIGLVRPAVNPSFLAWANGKKNLLAVHENEQGSISSYSVSEDTLLAINTQPTEGAHPCHVSVSSAGDILAANYSGGNVALFDIDAGGRISGVKDVQNHFGKGSHERQEAPHAHSAWFSPFGDDILSVDLGTNEVWFSQISGDTLRYNGQQKLAMEEKAGPRHLTFHPTKEWIYILNELNATVQRMEKNKDGQYVLKETISTLPEDFKKKNKCADIHISSDGKFLYASNRGHDSIIIYKIDQANGKLAYVGITPVHGQGPRNFAFSPDEKFVIVGNQHTNSIASFERDEVTGALRFVDDIKVWAPVCILF